MLPTTPPTAFPALTHSPGAPGAPGAPAPGFVGGAYQPAAGDAVSVLLVDDRPDNLLALEAVLEPLAAAGVRLRQATSGRQALERVAAEEFAAVVLDVQMPGLDGFETAQAIRESDALRRRADPAIAPTPLIFLTAGDTGDRARVAKAFALGAVDFLGKPFDPDEMRAKVAVFVELARTRRVALAVAAERAAFAVAAAKAEAARRVAEESQMRYRLLAETVPALVWTATPDGRIDYVSDQAAAYVGATPTEVLGEGWAAFLHPDDVTPTRHRWQRSVAAEQPYEIEFRIWSAATRTYRWHLGRAVPRRDPAGRVAGWVGANTDVEESKVAETALRGARAAAEQAAERARRLQALTAALSGALTPAQVADAVLREGMAALGAKGGGVTLVTADGAHQELVSVAGFADRDTRAWERFSLAEPYPANEVVARRAPVLLSTMEEYAARYPSLAVAVAAGGYHAYAAAPLEVDERVLGAIGYNFTESRTFTDDDRAFVLALAQQTAQALERARLYEAERAARTRAEEARARADEANRAKSEFLSTMSHELRTPLNAIAGYVDLLTMGLRGPVTDEQREDLARIRRSGQHLLALINDILNFARLDAGQVEFRIQDVHLDPVLADLEALVAPQVAAKGLTYSHQACGAPVAVRADPERLRQILLNLLTNAVKFTDVGGRIAIACDASDRAAVRVRVRDTGRGIPADQLERIFEPFVQVDRNLTPGSQQGVGLGLAISRDLARRMGGDLAAKSARGEGSTFTLTLPGAG